VHGLEVKETKTHAARRLAIDPATLELLLERRKAAEETAAAFDVALDPHAYLSTRCARPVRPDGMTNRFVTLANRTGARRPVA